MDERYERGELSQSRELWPDPISGPWSVDLTWEVVDGRMECVGAELRSYSKTVGASSPVKPIPITATTWRQVPIASLIESIRQEVAEQWAEDAEAPEAEEWVRAESERWGRRPGRRPRHDPAEVARIYTKAWQHTGKPTQAVAEHLGISSSAAAKQVARARSLGLLPPTQKGRPQGDRVTPKSPNTTNQEE